MTGRCEECGQYRPTTSDDVLAARMDCFRAAHAMLKDLYGGDEPTTWDTLTTARFLANDVHAPMPVGDEDE